MTAGAFEIFRAGPKSLPNQPLESPAPRSAEFEAFFPFDSPGFAR
jgi:hypothetical protein